MLGFNLDRKAGKMFVYHVGTGGEHDLKCNLSEFALLGGFGAYSYLSGIAYMLKYVASSRPCFLDLLQCRIWLSCSVGQPNGLASLCYIVQRKICKFRRLRAPEKKITTTISYT
jgi:hypothetical protein